VRLRAGLPGAALLVGLLVAGLLAAGPAQALREPADYRLSLAQDAAAHAQALSAAGSFDQAITVAQRYLSAFGPDPAVLYELAYAHNARGELPAAIRAYGQVLELNPEDASARYDRAELLLDQGDIDGAAADLAVALRLRPEHWAVHYRLAEIAAHRHDAAAFENELMASLQNGLDLRSLAEDPDWVGFAKDPVVGPVLLRVVTVYGNDETLQRLQGG